MPWYGSHPYLKEYIRKNNCRKILEIGVYTGENEEVDSFSFDNLLHLYYMGGDRMTATARIAAKGRVISCPASPSRRTHGPTPANPVESRDIYIGYIVEDNVSYQAVPSVQ